MRFKPKEEIAIIKQQILDYCTEYKKTGEIARHLNIHCSFINNYAYDLWQNGSFLDRIPEHTATKTRTWAYKTIIPVYKPVNTAVNAREEGKWNYIHCALFGHEPVEVKTNGRVFKIDERSDNSDYVQHLKEADRLRRAENKRNVTKGVFVSGQTLHMAV